MDEQLSQKVSILGTPVSRLDLQETIEVMSDAVENGDKLRICVTPVNCILWAREDEALREIYSSADIVTADGVPVVWASSLLGSRIRGRVTGLDLLPAYASVAAMNGHSFFFLGAAEGVGDELAEKLRSDNPGLDVRGVYSPPFRDTFSEKENAEMVERVNESGADILWVSLTAPKQDFWIAEHLDKLNVKVAIGVGAAFDVVAGRIPRSPQWMQKAGLEWLYRLSREPGRLAGRYLVEAPKFIPLVIRQKLMGGDGRRKR